ncbi:hypothetical protein BDV26DRAFT_278976 [Aspergillus bertholletiae]|uniref:Uncharacterized protein n=1 Tax=Aspergillus bertholletiae TaxID=1226010 RepID=A0A5N7BHE7_9EURO|nr:hypothetical protein BDV26DRAFT_278976 [Aspergillus bertholletiae]
MGNPMPSRYRSATEYSFDEEQADAIYSPREHVDIRPSRATPFQRTANDGLGSLERAPPRALVVVDSLQQYQRVASHALNLFCALLRTRLAFDISLFDFYDALCTKACTLCGEFGGFSSPETQVRTLASVRRQFHMAKVELAQPRASKSLPGIYSMDESIRYSRIAIVSLPQSLSASFDRNQKFNFMGPCAHPYYDRQTGKVEHGIACAGCQLAIEKDIIGTRWDTMPQTKTSGEAAVRQPALPVSARTGGYFRRSE